MLQVQDVSTFYGRIQALRGVSLEVNAGEIVSLVGANGAGKTTLLNSVSGLVSPRRGRVFLGGQDITGLKPEKIVSLGVSQVPEHRQVFGTFSVRDNLNLGAYLRLRRGEQQAVEKDIAFVYSLFPVLEERQNQLADTLSGGEQQMLVVGRGLMARPKVLLLDEPSLGLAPIIVEYIFQVFQQLQETGTTILLVEQNVTAALEVSDRVYVLETGRIVLSGPAEELMADEAVQQAYLGQQLNGTNS
jgi:branched-chain amino acid transport system ATP-binding protein